MHQLDREDRLRLLRFVCSFAWADLEVQEAEKSFVLRLVQALELPPEDLHEVDMLLRVPPRPEDIDPLDVPAQHRAIFLETVRGLVMADGTVSEGEAETFELLEQLLL